MPILSRNEIKDRAMRFANEWADTCNEEADAKPFLDAFFDIFGISRKRVSTFEHRIKKLDEKDGYIDLLWKGTILIEMKSRGKNLDKAYEQAKAYTHGLKDFELPKYILVSDFQRFRLYNLEAVETPNLGVSTENAKFHNAKNDNNCRDVACNVSTENATHLQTPKLSVSTNYIEFELSDLLKNIHYFDFLAGYQKVVYKEQDPVNIQAAELMGKLHDRLLEIGYEGHPLEVYLVRILFCLFAEDTEIFTKQSFQLYVEQRTNEDGSDLAAKLDELFKVLNTPQEKRLKNLDEQLAEFPYVNGKLFEEFLPNASFDKKMRQALLDCCQLDWSKISPAIFGSMFQSVMNPAERRNLGAHYTSEKNILKLIKPLFLDELYAEFQKIKDNKSKLIEFHKRIANMKFLDPACGCGNFLIITYRELRLLELEILKSINKINKSETGHLNIGEIIWLDVDQFYGIEIEEFPARIAEVAMWLIDHQMNMRISAEFGQYFIRLPLKKAAKITHGNALQIDWHGLVDGGNDENIFTNVETPNLGVSTENNNHIVQTPNLGVSTGNDNIHTANFTYIFGNPPFSGSKIMTQKQRDEIAQQFENISGCGVLDYVTGWYVKAAKYIQNTNIKAAFVSTNSIVQGEQTSILWQTLMNKFNIKIHFAHRTFKWRNEGRANAAVYCVIIGFANFDTNDKSIFDYVDIKGEAHEIKARNINAYLVDAKDVFITKRSTPLCNVPKMNFGNIALDSGFLIFNEAEKNEFILIEPQSKKWFKKLLGANELLYNETRWCLWLVDIEPNALRSMPHVLERTKNVQKARLAARDKGTQKLAERSHQFRDLNNPETYIAIPITTGENRKYIPLVYANKDLVPAVTVQAIPNGNLYHFGVLSSAMHMAWVRYVCGRLKSDYRYSKDIVYNNYPWAENPSEKQIKAVEAAAQQVLDIRLEYPNSSFADLYDPLTMPPKLTKVHQTLDKAVDLCYRPQKFDTETSRMEYLFELYEKYVGGIFVKEKKGGRKGKSLNDVL